MTRPRIALVGAGSMGANHARVLAESGRAEFAYVVDPDMRRAREVADGCGSPACVAEVDDRLLASIDAVVVAAPTDAHLEVARVALAAGCPTLVEKPLATTPADIELLIGESESRDVPLMCGFVERFNAAVATARSVLDGPVRHMMCLRHSPPAPRIGVSVVWDLLVHDIDLFLQITDAGASAMTRGSTFTPGWSDTSEVADCLVSFSGGVASLSASRMSQRKVRSLTISSDDQLVEVDLLRQTVTVYYHVSQEQRLDEARIYRAETVVDIPFVRHRGEPLALQLDHFLDLVEGVADPDAERRGILGPHAIAFAVEGGG